MKLKRFLSLAVALAMVLSIVPAFSLTASAAEETVLFDAANVSTANKADNGDVALSEGNWSGDWGSGFSTRWNNGTWDESGYFEPVGLMFFRTSERGKDGSNYKTATYNGASASAGANKITISFKYAIQEASDCYQTWYFRDIDGNNFARFYGDKNTNSGTASIGLNTQTTFISSGGTLSIRGQEFSIVATKGASNWTVEYYQGTTLLGSDTVDSINGFGSIYADIGVWNTQWAAAGMQGLKITYEKPETTKSVTATYTLNGETVDTVEKTYDSAVAEGAEFPQYIAPCANGTNVLYAAAATTLSADATIELEAVANADVAGYEVGKVFANNNKQYEVKSANLIPNGDFSLGKVAWYTGISTAMADGFSLNGDGTAKGTANTGTAGASSIWRAWATEVGKTYLLTFDSSVLSGYFVVSEKSDLSATGDGTVVTTAVAGANTVVYTATQPYLLASFRWMNGSSAGNFGLYEIAEAETTITETVASVADLAEVKVFGNETVNLPTTVAVTGSLGSDVNAPIEWDAPESYEVGKTTTVNGVATVQFGEQEATTENVSVDVTIVKEFTLNDITSAYPAPVAYFPVAISGEFMLQFDMTASNYDNLWIYISNNGALWSAGQIGLGWDNAGKGDFKAQPDADTVITTFDTNKTYRFFVTGNAATDTYDLMVVDLATNSVIVNINDYGFRSNSDVINSIAFTANGENGVGTMSNIKVKANLSKTVYTFNITKDGETASTTASFWHDAEALASVADVDGYEKTVTIDGTTITVVYSNVYTATATFKDAAGNVIKEVSETVTKGETYTVNAEEIFYIDGEHNGYFYQIPETVLSADNNDLEITVTETPNKYAAMEDILLSKPTGGAETTEIWGIKATNKNSIFVGGASSNASAPATDANGENTYGNYNSEFNLGSARAGLVQFPVVDVTEGQKVTANFYVREWHQQTWQSNSNRNDKIRLAAQLVNDDSWTSMTDGGIYTTDNYIFEDYSNIIFSDWANSSTEWVTFDITEAMMAAKAAGLETISLRLSIRFGAAYIAEREAAVVGGAYEGKAAYIKVEDAGLVKVTETGSATLTKNGSDVNGVAYVAATDDVRLTASGAVVVGTDAGYYEANKTMSITEATDFENTVPAGLGLEMVSGAQVRIGATKLADGAKLDAMADSGIRFLAKANYKDTVLADANVEFGIKVQAEESDQVAYVKAETFQDEDNTVFSAAIVNLAESNYNRNYTACAYAFVPMADGSTKEFTAGEVTRSIYQVSAGIMKTGAADDPENAAYTVDGVVKNILNAYINQTGIRLTYTADGITVEENKYTGDVFFAVESTVNEDGSVSVTITPDATWGTPAEIATWWQDYVRVNNNNSVAKTYISDAKVVDGVLTFTFTVPAAEEAE